MSRLSVSYVIPYDYRIITTMMSSVSSPLLTTHSLRLTHTPGLAFAASSFHSANQILISVDAHSSFMCAAASHYPPSTINEPRHTAREKEKREKRGDNNGNSNRIPIKRHTHECADFQVSWNVENREDNMRFFGRLDCVRVCASEAKSHLRMQRAIERMMCFGSRTQRTRRARYPPSERQQMEIKERNINRDRRAIEDNGLGIVQRCTRIYGRRCRLTLSPHNFRKRQPTATAAHQK